MRNLERIELLKGYCVEEPQNPFNYYALALEFREFDKVEAGKLFDFVVLNFPNYLPVYFSAAQFFFENENYPKTKNLSETGIELAHVLEDEKAKKELSNAYQNFLFETDLD